MAENGRTVDAVVTDERVLYLYGVIPRDQGLPDEVGAAVQAVSHSAVVALVEPVCAQEFSPDTLNEKLKSIEWVASLAHKHEAVLECAMRHGPVVPARLCTLFCNTDSLRTSLAENEERFLATLEWVQAREEWGLKVFCDQGRLHAVVGLEDAQVRALDSEAAKASPGQAFVLRKRRDARLLDAAAARIDAMADETVEVLEHDAVDMRLRPLLLEAATGRTEPMVLNIAALVDKSSCSAFRDRHALLSARFQAEGFSFEASGPWPPYSFCDDEGTDATGSEAEPGEEGE
ncbi:MAG: GvpL/GvpF family gas vesicle protein [Deltaproteobacteria bacterium]|nr:GvpL/GvpF family gas vesicle protein [Deltaproteobacteria bacterium]